MAFPRSVLQDHYPFICLPVLHILCTAVVVAEAESFTQDSPGFVDCTFDEEWTRFHTLLRGNSDAGFPFDNQIFEVADHLISKHLFTFLDFHRSKSNEFFHDCDRRHPRGMVCLYGMLSAFLIHHIYLRHKFSLLGIEEITDGEIEIFGHSTQLARMMLINKNNCLDFFDSSGWPFTLDVLIEVLHPSPAFVLNDDEQELPTKAGFASMWSWGKPAARPSPWPRWGWLRPRTAPHVSKVLEERSLLAYITGTHASLAKEVDEMMTRFVGPILGTKISTFLEVVDDTHCGYVGCQQTDDDNGDVSKVGLQHVVGSQLRARWNGLDILDLPQLVKDFESVFTKHRLSRDADLFVCTTPVVLCTIFASFDKPLLGYLGEPILLAVAGDDRMQWFEVFESLVTNPRNFFTCYNPFLAEMIQYQTGLFLPVIRLHGLYTRATYNVNPDHASEILVIKGPNICADPVCLLNRFAALSAGLSDLLPAEDNLSEDSSGRAFRRGGQFSFRGLDELGGAPYDILSSFRAAILYPYDVALAIFYEFYSMCMPLFLPHVRLLPFFVFRGIHSTRAFHHVQLGFGANASGSSLSPFIGAKDVNQWFFASRYWSDRTDFARFPHLLRFGTFAELLAQLVPGATDWMAISLSMKRFNEETLTISAADWADGIASALGGSAGTARDTPRSTYQETRADEVGVTCSASVSLPREWDAAMTLDSDSVINYLKEGRRNEVL